MGSVVLVSRQFCNFSSVSANCPVGCRYRQRLLGASDRRSGSLGGYYIDGLAYCFGNARSRLNALLPNLSSRVDLVCEQVNASISSANDIRRSSVKLVYSSAWSTEIPLSPAASRAAIKSSSCSGSFDSGAAVSTGAAMAAGTASDCSATLPS